MIYLIVACDDNFLIGNNTSINGLPWNNKEDLQHFKKTTYNKKVLYGSNTYKSMGKILPNRENFIVSGNIDKIDNAVIVRDLNDFLSSIKNTNEDIYICGGASIYQQSLDFVDIILMSRIPGKYEGTTFFPTFLDKFTKTDEIKYNTFTLEIYKKR